MAQLRVSLGFADASDHTLEETASEVVSGLYGNAAVYATPPFLVAVLEASLGDFRQKLADQASTGTQGTAAKDQARAALITLLRQLAAYVQKVIQDNDAFGMAELLLSGFDAVSTSRTQRPLVAPVIQDLVNAGEATMQVRAKSDANTRMLEVQYRVQGTTVWGASLLFASTRGMLVTGLTPGAVYEFRIRGLGGSTKESEWSNTVARRSL